MTEDVQTQEPDYAPFIKEWEGYKDSIYLDSVGKRTLGYGHLITKDDPESDEEEYPVGTKIPVERSEELFQRSLETAKSDARRLFPSFDEHPDNVKKMLVDMSFNLGRTRLSGFTKFREAIESKNYFVAAKEAKDSNWYKQVKRRAKHHVDEFEKLYLNNREQEKEFLSGANYFDSDMGEVDDYFTRGVWDSRPKFLYKGREQEVAGAAAVLQFAETQEDISPMLQDMESNLHIFGSDPVVDSALGSLRAGLKQSIMQAGPQVLLQKDKVVQSDLEGLDEAIKVVDKLPDTPLLITAAAEASADPNKDYGFLFDGVMNRIMVDTALSDFIDEAEEKVEWTFMDWVGAFTVSPVTERAFRVEVLDQIGLKDGVLDYSFRTGHADKVVSWVRSAPTAEESIERMQLLLEVVLREGDNGVYASGLLQDVRDKLTTGQASGETFVDALELFVIADIKDIGRGLKFLATKALGGIQKRSGRSDAQAIADAEEILQETADAVMPVQQPAVLPKAEPKVKPVAAAVSAALPPMRLGKQSAFDALHQSNPAVTSSILQYTPAPEMDTVLKGLGITSAQVAQRFWMGAPNEGMGIGVSWITGSRSASPVVSMYDNVAQGVADQLDNVARQSLYTAEERLRGVDREVKLLKQASNGALQPQNTRILQQSDTTDEIQFEVVFGKTSDEGYDSLDEAEYARSYLMGTEGTSLLARVKGSKQAPQAVDTLTIVPRSSTGTMVERFESTNSDASITTYELFKTGETYRSVLTKADGTRVTSNHKGMEQALKHKNRKLMQAQGNMKAVEIETLPLDGNVEYFVRGVAKHTLVPMDANAFGSSFFGAGIPGLSYLMPYSNRISGELFNQISAFTDRTSAVAERLIEIAKPVRKMSAADKVAVDNLVMYGDQNSIVFTKQAAMDYLGGRLTNRAWEGYKAMRQYYDVMHDLRNRRQYLSLSADGFKSLLSPAGRVIEDSKGKVFGRPVNIDSVSVKQLVDEDGNIVNVVAPKRAKLADDGTVIEPEVKGTLRELEEAGGTVVRTSRDVSFTGDVYFTHMIIRDRGNVKPLTMHPLTKRKGHADLMYRSEDPLLKRLAGGHVGGTGYTVSKVRRIIKDGEESVREDVIGIFANKPQAARFRAQAIAKLRDEAEEGEEIDDLFTLSMTREKAAELGLDDATDMMGVPVHSLGRGDRLQGPKGMAEVMNPTEAMTATLGEIRRTLGHDVIDLLKSRFMAKYAKYMQHDGSGLRFPVSLEDLNFRKEFANLKPEADELFKFIRTQENGMTGKYNASYMDAWRRYAESMYNRDRPFARGIARLMNSAFGQAPIALLAKTNQLTAIAGRVLYQTVANSAQMITMFAKDPVLFARTIPSVMAVMAAKVVRYVKDDPDSSKLMDVFGWFLDMDGQTFARYMDQLDESGITATGISDDVFSLLFNGTRIAAGDMNVKTAEFWGRIGSRALKPLIIPQEAAAKLTNLTAYVHSTKMAQRRGDDIFSNAGRDRVAGDMRKLTFTQNRADQLPYQQNVLSISLQFMHHVHKMFLNTIVLPMYWSARATGGALRGKFDFNAKVSENIYSETKAQALTTFGMMIGMFGTTGLIGEDAAMSLEEKMQELPQEVRTLVLDGIFNVGFEKFMGETFNVSSRFAALDFHRQFLDFVFNPDLSVNILGPSSMLFDNLAHIKDWVRDHHNNDAMTSEEFWDTFGKESLRLFAGYRDYEKAMIMRNAGQYVTSEGTVISDGHNQSAWGALMISLTPNTVPEYYSNGDFAKQEQQTIDNIVSTVLRDFTAWSRENPDASIPQIQEAIHRRIYSIVIPAVGADRVEALEYAKDKILNRMYREDADPMVLKQIQKLFSISTNSKQSLMRLERIVEEQYPELNEHPMIEALRREVQGNN